LESLIYLLELNAIYVGEDFKQPLNTTQRDTVLA